jgi:hypothetical protein
MAVRRRSEVIKAYKWEILVKLCDLHHHLNY